MTAPAIPGLAALAAECTLVQQATLEASGRAPTVLVICEHPRFGTLRSEGEDLEDAVDAMRDQIADAKAAVENADATAHTDEEADDA